MQHHAQAEPTGQFPTDATGLPEARAAELVELSDGDRLDLRIAPVAKRLGDATVRMLAYNGSIPGPTLKVREGSEVVVDVENQGDMDATVHWHGLRLENRYDGTHETQRPMAVGERFSARVAFPDPGLYWYHPHIREDYGQEMGLYGNVLVEPADPGYWPPVHREVVLTLDDILLEDGKVAPFSRAETTYAAMGRFGDVLLVGGEPDLVADRATRRGGAPVPDQHRQHAGVQGRAAGRADEARRRRQRPRRARAVRRRRRCWRRRSASSSTSCSTRTASSRWSTTHRIGSIPWPRSPSATIPPSRRCVSSSRSCAPTRTWRPSGSASRRIWTPSPTRGSRSWPRWTWTPRKGTGRSSTPARCTLRWSASSRATARSAQ